MALFGIEGITIDELNNIIYEGVSVITIEELHDHCHETVKVYHFKISINKDDYFFIAETLNIGGGEEVIEIRRGKAVFDCAKRLKTSEKKQVKRMIELMFNV